MSGDPNRCYDMSDVENFELAQRLREREAQLEKAQMEARVAKDISRALTGHARKVEGQRDELLKAVRNIASFMTMIEETQTEIHPAHMALVTQVRVAAQAALAKVKEAR